MYVQECKKVQRAMPGGEDSRLAEHAGAFCSCWNQIRAQKQQRPGAGSGHRIFLISREKQQAADMETFTILGAKADGALVVKRWLAYRSNTKAGHCHYRCCCK